LSAKLLLLWVIAWRSVFLAVSIWKILYRTSWCYHKKTWKPMEYNRRPWRKPTKLEPSGFWQRGPKYALEKNAHQAFLLQKTKSRSKSHTSISSKWITDVRAKITPGTNREHIEPHRHSSNFMTRPLLAQ
jgi:hypothetical protein